MRVLSALTYIHSERERERAHHFLSRCNSARRPYLLCAPSSGSHRWMVAEGSGGFCRKPAAAVCPGALKSAAMLNVLVTFGPAILIQPETRTKVNTDLMTPIQKDVFIIRNVNGVCEDQTRSRSYLLSKVPIIKIHTGEMFAHVFQFSREQKLLQL